MILLATCFLYREASHGLSLKYYIYVIVTYSEGIGRLCAQADLATIPGSFSLARILQLN